MKLRLFLLLAFLLMMSWASFAQPLDSLAGVLLHPPKASQFSSIAEAFQSFQTYVGAVLVFLTVYVAQWIPGIAQALSYLKPYFRAIIVGAAVLWALISFGTLQDSQASLSLILSNVLYVIVGLFKSLPSPTAQMLYESRLTDN